MLMKIHRHHQNPLHAGPSRMGPQLQDDAIYAGQLERARDSVVDFKNGATASEIGNVAWQKARASEGLNACVEIAQLPDGQVGVRNSRHPEGPVLVFTKAEMMAFYDGASKREFDLPTV
ncbi:DUF397 domain-containing protein [Streptomyces sp. NPDC059913]|uniref:DUF397 domain-containing protein n=1 Tax=unclassified Streptomyces TaxID=2593676 RepID=UPI00365BED89